MSCCDGESGVEMHVKHREEYWRVSEGSASRNRQSGEVRQGSVRVNEQGNWNLVGIPPFLISGRQSYEIISRCSVSSICFLKCNISGILFASHLGLGMK